MKMKNMLIGGMSLALVACISVGATLAYLSDTTDVVTNTFTFDNSIGIELKEHDVDDWNEETNNWEEGLDWEKDWVYENSYDDILPNDVLQKDPTVKVTTMPDRGMELYVIVSGLTDEMRANISGSVWEKIADEEGNTEDPMFGGQDGVYKYIGETPLAVGSQVPVFTTVTIGDVTTKLNDATVKINAYAVQKGSLGDDQEGHPLTQDGVAIDALVASLAPAGD